jgi:PAS domain S-box-containing protein
MSVADMDQTSMNTDPAPTRGDVNQARPTGTEPAPAGDEAHQASWFHLSFVDQHWEWSAATARLHGYQPDEVTPDTELVLSHQHPGDRRSLATTIDEIRRSSRSLSSRHRIVDTNGRLHHVIVVGDPIHDENGVVTGVRGFYVETSAPRDSNRELSVSAAVAEIAESRAVIEQAKGMLMVIYRIDADAAFELLKWRSQMTNTKLRTLSERIAADFLAMDGESNLPQRPEYDDILLTAHLRVTPND